MLTLFGGGELKCFFMSQEMYGLNVMIVGHLALNNDIKNQIEM